MGKSESSVKMGDADKFRVVIAGGGLAGLTLANSLEVCTTSVFSAQCKQCLANMPCSLSKQVSIMSCWNGVTLLRPMSAPRLPFTPTALGSVHHQHGTIHRELVLTIRF